QRASAFSAWSDSALVYFRKGMASGVVLPAALVKKMIPQMESMVVTDPSRSLFYGPVSQMPSSFSDSDRKRLTSALTELIGHQLVPSYQKLAAFLKNEYL